MLSLLPLSDILKVSEDEMTLLTGESNIQKGAKTLQAHGPKLLLVTLGSQGSYFLHEKSSGWIPALKIQAMDTTGCGDAFLGAFLSEWIRTGLLLDQLKPEDHKELLAFASCAGSITSCRQGGILALPEEGEIRKLKVVL